MGGQSSIDVVSNTLHWVQVALIASVFILTTFLIPTLFKLRRMEFNRLWAARSLLTLCGCVWLVVILIRLYRESITTDLHLFHNDSTWCMLYAVPQTISHLIFFALIYVLFDSISTERTNREIVGLSLGIVCLPCIIALGLAIAPWIKPASDWSVWTDFRDPKSQECTIPFALGIMRSALNILWLVMTQRTCDEAIAVARNKRLRHTIRRFLSLTLVLVPVSSSVWAVSTVYIFGYPHIQQLLLDSSGILDAMIVHASLAILVWKPLRASIHASEDRTEWGRGARVQPRTASLSLSTYKEEAAATTTTAVAVSAAVQNNQSPRVNSARRASVQKGATYDVNRKDVTVSNV